MPELGKVAQIAIALAMPSSLLLLYWYYKRSSTDEDEFHRNKVVTSRNTRIEVQVPQRAVGSIIGRQGANIKQLQKETGTRITFQDKEQDAGDGSGRSGVRTLVITGSAEAAQQAELIIHQTVVQQPEVLTEVVEVPQYAVGRIIGKGGASIRQISYLSEARIMVQRNEDFHTPESLRTITLKGTRQQIDKAVEMLEEKLEEEEQLRSRLSMTAANRGQRKKDVKHKEHMKPVPAYDDQQWDEQHNNSAETNGGTGTDQLPLKPGFVEVYVSAVEHPGHFWVQVVGTKALQLETIQEDITRFVSTDEAKMNYKISTVSPGMLVAARYEESDHTYYRAKVLNKMPDGKVDVYFVDFGDNAFVDKEDLYRLRPDFTSFPFQAIECQLANVEPVGGTRWSEDAITCFEELTLCAQWKIVFARVITQSQRETGDGDASSCSSYSVVELVDTSSSQDVNIGAELVKRGFATDSQGCKHKAMGGVSS